MFVFERIYLLLCLCLSKTILAIFNGFGVYGFIPYKGVTPLPPVGGQQIAEKVPHIPLLFPFEFSLSDENNR